tara:strand:+ start:269 stop:907 length:639 start_codon:yes stop_codon:yes gene_type:complete
MNGFIYVMSNASFADGRIKIGMSASDPTRRKEELYSTGVPEPFTIEYYAFVEDFESIEKNVHVTLDSYRPNKNREFFNCSIEKAISTIRELSVINYEEYTGEITTFPNNLVGIKKYLQQRFIICPLPDHLRKIHYSLEQNNKQSIKIKGPLILGGWNDSTDLEKYERFVEHLSIAQELGVLEETINYLNKLDNNENNFYFTKEYPLNDNKAW